MIYRNDAVCTAFLRWLAEQERDHALSPTFLTDPASVVDSQQVTRDELTQALDTLATRGLIDGYGGIGYGRLARVWLTPTGRVRV
ncbi:MAG TPA: hypothetical protein VGD71_14195 [Kribbella sp.]